MPLSGSLSDVKSAVQPRPAVSVWRRSNAALSLVEIDQSQAGLEGSWVEGMSRVCPDLADPGINYLQPTNLLKTRPALGSAPPDSQYLIRLAFSPFSYSFLRKIS